jgi:hypothetical protein
MQGLVSFNFEEDIRKRTVGKIFHCNQRTGSFTRWNNRKDRMDGKMMERSQKWKRLLESNDITSGSGSTGTLHEKGNMSADVGHFINNARNQKHGDFESEMRNA